jgi:hypothetical protein
VGYFFPPRHNRNRHIPHGPAGLRFQLNDETDGALLRIDPAK